jgi:hypothetical protein
VLGPSGFITKPRNQMHAMWNAGDKPGRILEVIAPGGFASYFRGLGELLADMTPSPGERSTRPRSSPPWRPATA